MTKFSVNKKPAALILPVGTVQKEWRAIIVVVIASHHVLLKLLSLFVNFWRF